MAKVAIEHVERHIEESLNRVLACRPDLRDVADGSIGKIKMLLSYLHDAESGFIANFFVDSLCKGPAHYVREFYIDDRAWPGTSRPNRWSDGITRGMAQRVYRQLDDLEAERAKGSSARRSGGLTGAFGAVSAGLGAATSGFGPAGVERYSGAIHLRYQTRSPRMFTPLSALKGQIPVGSLWHVTAWRANDGTGGYGVWLWDGKTLVAANVPDPFSRMPARPSEVGKPWSKLYPGRHVVTLTPVEA